MSDLSCPTCGVDLEYVVFEAASAYRGQKEIQIPCPHCQESLLFLHWEPGIWQITKESEYNDV